MMQHAAEGSNFQYLTEFKEKLLNATSETMGKSLNNVHCDGLFSLVIAGNEHGKLLRVFIAHKKIKPAQIQYHTHRYPIRLTVLKGTMTDHVATWDKGSPDYKPESVAMDWFMYQSPLNNGKGLTFAGKRKYSLSDRVIPKGCSVNMAVEQFHTVSCSKGAIWIVEEQGFQVDHSFVLGTPFVTEGLYTEPLQFQTNDNWQLVKGALAEILNSYQVLGISDGYETEKS
ncbi:hypothetical protein [Acinetobacter bereziniae]|nr:hypothetical protein [Acinetobacter bereziniae]